MKTLNLIKELKDLLLNNGDILKSPLFLDIFMDLKRDPNNLYIYCTSNFTIYTESMDGFGDTEEWEYEYDLDSILKIFFRKVLKRVGISANYATWMWYNWIDKARTKGADKLIILNAYLHLKQILKMARLSCQIRFVEEGALFPSSNIIRHKLKLPNRY